MFWGPGAEAQLLKKLKDKFSKNDNSNSSNTAMTKTKYEPGDVVWIKDDSAPEGKTKAKIVQDKLYINLYLVETPEKGFFDCEAKNVIGLYQSTGGDLKPGDQVFRMSPTYTTLEAGVVEQMSGVNQYEVRIGGQVYRNVSKDQLLSGWDYGAFYGELQPYLDKQDIKAYFYRVCGEECVRERVVIPGSGLGEERTKTMDADLKAMQAIVAKYADLPDNGQPYYFYNPTVLANALKQWNQVKANSQAADLGQKVEYSFFDAGPRSFLDQQPLKGPDGKRIYWDEYAIWKGLDKLRGIMIQNVQAYAQQQGIEVDPEQVLAAGKYDEKIAEVKKKTEEEMADTRRLIQNYKYTDASALPLVKREIFPNPTRVIMKQAPSEWIVKKNSLGVILERYRMGFAFKQLPDSEMWLGYTFSIYQDYTGGGTFGSPRLRYNPEARSYAKPF